MKIKSLLFFIILFFPIYTFSQIQGEDEVYLKGDLIEPKFNDGGLDKFYEFINQQFTFSKVKEAEKLLFAFTVNTEGELKDIKILEFKDIEVASEVIRVLNLSPKWESAKRGGKPISTEMKLPLEVNVKIKTISVANIKSVINKQLTDKTILGTQKEIIYLSDAELDDENNKSIEIPPSYSSGLKKFYQFIAENYRTPDVEGLKGKVIVSFVVDLDGSLTDFKILKDLGYGTGKEAIRVLKKSPKWTPGTQNGVPVRVVYSLPINVASSFSN